MCERSALPSPIETLKDATHLVYPLMVSAEKIVFMPFLNQIIVTTISIGVIQDIKKYDK